MKEPFANAVKEALNQGTSLQELMDIARTHKDLGLSQESAYEALAELRQQVSESLDDQILELMDVVSGWCQPNQNIWDKTVLS